MFFRVNKYEGDETDERGECSEMFYRLKEQIVMKSLRVQERNDHRCKKRQSQRDEQTIVVPVRVCWLATEADLQQAGDGMSGIAKSGTSTPFATNDTLWSSEMRLIIPLDFIRAIHCRRTAKYGDESTKTQSALYTALV